ncbi:MAG: Yip1 family protein [Terricaulis sp.]
MIINALAPTFGSQQDQLQAHKLSVYTATAGLLAGVFAIHPALGILGILGIYSLFLLYLGLPKLMKTPADKVIGYFLTIIVVMIVVGIVLGLVVTTIRGAVGGFGGASSWHFGSAQQAPVDQRVELPGGGSIDVGQLERAAQEAQQAYTENGNVKPVDLAQLQALLPDSLPGGFARTSISSSSAGAAMAGASQAEAVYQRGQSSITLSVMQMGGMGALASMAGAMGVQGNHEDANGYSRIRTENGRTVTEELNRASATAEYAVIGRNGVAVSASGQSVTLDDVRAAVNALGVERAEALAAN